MFSTKQKILQGLGDFPRAWALLLDFIHTAALSKSNEVRGDKMWNGLDRDVQILSLVYMRLFVFVNDAEILKDKIIRRQEVSWCIGY